MRNDKRHCIVWELVYIKTCWHRVIVVALWIVTILQHKFVSCYIGCPTSSAECIGAEELNIVTGEAATGTTLLRDVCTWRANPMS